MFNNPSVTCTQQQAIPVIHNLLPSRKVKHIKRYRAVDLKLTKSGCRFHSTSDLLALAVIEVIKDAEKVEEEIDDIEIEGDGGMDVLLSRHLVHDHVGVVDDVEGKEHCTADRNEEVKPWAAQEQL